MWRDIVSLGCLRIDLRCHRSACLPPNPLRLSREFVYARDLPPRSDLLIDLRHLTARDRLLLAWLADHHTLTPADRHRVVPFGSCCAETVDVAVTDRWCWQHNDDDLWTVGEHFPEAPLTGRWRRRPRDPAAE